MLPLPYLPPGHHSSRALLFSPNLAANHHHLTRLQSPQSLPRGTAAYYYRSTACIASRRMGHK
ncbi:hypothetical protein ACP4OV_018211 [Aristida adscensionis]